MANPQPDKFTRWSNELSEHLYQVRMSGAEWQMMLFLGRITFGFGKTWIELSTCDFVEGKLGVLGLGLDRRRIIEARKALIAKNMIEVRESGQGKQYRIQKDYDKWIDVRKNGHVRENGNPCPEKRTLSDRENGRLSTIERKKEKSKEIKTPPAEALRLAQLLANHVSQVHPKHRMLLNGRRQKTIASWADEMRLMRERDDRQWVDVENLIGFIKTDIRPTNRPREFPGWGVTVQSAGNLRQKFDKIWAQFSRQGGEPAKPAGAARKSLYTKNYYEGL